MKLVRPVSVLDAVLTSSNTIEVSALAAYNAGTTYGLNAEVSVTTGTLIVAYISLAPGNTGNTPASSPLWWRKTGETYAVYNAGTSYSINDIVISVSANVHLSYRSLVNSNLGNALTDVTKWLALGATNRWKKYDAAVNSQSVRPLSMTDVLTTAELVDTVACLNVDAAEIIITQTDPVEGVVFNQTFSMISDSGITDPYAYCFEPIVRLTDLIVSGLLPYTGALISVTLNNPSSDAKIGALILGLSADIGATQYGASVGIIDYSVKSTDVFGNIAIVERSYSKRGDFTVWVPNTLIDTLQINLANFRATPILYLGSDQYTSTAIYGFFKDFSVAIAYPTVSVCTINIEGLT